MTMPASPFPRHGLLEPPGTPGGPCGHDCRHTYCVLVRVAAEAPCRLCRKPVGYSRGFEEPPRGGVQHDSCDPTKPGPALYAKKRPARASAHRVEAIVPEIGFEADALELADARQAAVADREET